MILALLAAAQVPAPTPTPDPEEVVVIARRFGTWRATVRSNPLGTHCRIDRSTGNAALDKVGCDAMLACWPAAKAVYKQVEDRRRDAAERQRLKAETDAAFGGCIKVRRETLIAGLLPTHPELAAAR